MPATFLLLILLPTFARSYVENEDPTLHRNHNHNHAVHNNYKGWTGPPTTRPQNYRMDSPPIVLSETTDDWTSIAITDLLNQEDSKYATSVLPDDFAEKLASDFYLGKEAPKDDYRGAKLATDSGSRQESYVSETESEPRPKWKTAPPPVKYNDNEATPTATSVKERYVDLGRTSDEEESSEEEYIPTGKTKNFEQGRIHYRDSIYDVRTERVGGVNKSPKLRTNTTGVTHQGSAEAPSETKVFADIDDREVIHYLGGDGAKAEALIDEMAKEIQDSEEEIDKAQFESMRQRAEETKFEGVDDSELLNYLARDPKVAEEVIRKAKLIKLQ